MVHFGAEVALDFRIALLDLKESRPRGALKRSKSGQEGPKSAQEWPKRPSWADKTWPRGYQKRFSSGFLALFGAMWLNLRIFYDSEAILSYSGQVSLNISLFSTKDGAKRLAKKLRKKNV